LKLLKVMLFLMALLCVNSLYAAPLLTSFFGYRYTDLSPSEPNLDLHKVRIENVDIYSDGTGILTTRVSEETLSFEGMTVDVLNTIAGQVVQTEAVWVSFSRGWDLSNFKRSSETYLIDGVPNVIVSLSGASGGGNIPSVKIPNVNISAIDTSASEIADDTGQFVINFNAPVKKNIKIKFKLSGNATKGKDYERIPNSIVIPAGNTQGIIEIIPINDTKKEGVEKVIITLDPDSAKRYKLRGRKKAVVKILDND
jgi:hypothetical protein